MNGQQLPLGSDEALFRPPTGGGQETAGPGLIAPAATPTIRVPDSLIELDQWIVWRYEQRDGSKPTKVPYQVNGSLASSTDPKTWCSFDEALKARQQDDPTRCSGIGFVFCATDPFFGIDLDHCLDVDGRLKPWAQPIMDRFSDTYAEISPSGSGIKIWARGKLAGGGTAFTWGDGRVEIYDQARYFTVTGNHWAGQMLEVSPSPPSQPQPSRPSAA